MPTVHQTPTSISSNGKRNQRGSGAPHRKRKLLCAEPHPAQHKSRCSGHTCAPALRKSGDQGHPWLHSKFMASLRYRRPCLDEPINKMRRDKGEGAGTRHGREGRSCYLAQAVSAPMLCCGIFRFCYLIQ